MECPLCSATNPVATKVCRSCGADLSVGGSSSEGSSLPAGTKLASGKYTVGKVLGQGGFGITYRGADTTLQRTVAIKEFFPQGAARSGTTVIPSGGLTLGQFQQDKDRFLEEARTLAQFRHHAIVQVYECFEDNGTAYMAMELIKGRSVEQWIVNDGTIDEARTLRWLREIGAALELVHKSKLLHRDIKPQNILITEEGRAVLIDFGTARTFADGKTSRMTQMLTPGYAPLEQYGQQMRFGESTDIYALCATAYHMLTGELPVQATDRAMGVELKPPHLKATVSRRVSDAIVAGMSLKAADRPQSIAELLKRLEHGLPPGPGSASPSGAGDPPADADSDLLTLAIEKAFNEWKAIDPSNLLPATVRPEMERILGRLNQFRSFQVSDPDLCPGCRSENLVSLRGEFDGTCVVCEATKLRQRKTDDTRCPVCRETRLERERLEGIRMVCPVCKTSLLKKELRKQLGLSIDVWWTCDCGAEFDLLLAGRVKLVSFKEDPYGFGAKHAGRTFEKAEWFETITQVLERHNCGECGARWYVREDHGWLLTAAKKDPHRVVPSLRNRTLSPAERRQLVLGADHVVGDIYCPGCQSEFQFDRPKKELTLLWLDGAAQSWIQPWLGNPRPLQEWTLMRAGKQSYHPGWLCRACDTEFDESDEVESASEGGWLLGLFSSAKAAPDAFPKRLLRRTSSLSLQPFLGKARGAVDWHRTAADIPTAAEATALEGQLVNLEATEKAERREMTREAEKQKQAAQTRLLDLIKLSTLAGNNQRPPYDPRVRLRAGEQLRWEAPGEKLLQRTRQGSVFWESDTRGMLVVTTERVLFLADHVVDEWPLAKVSFQRDDYHGCAVLMLWLANRKKPIGIVPFRMNLNVTCNGETFKIEVHPEDLFRKVLSVR